MREEKGRDEEERAQCRDLVRQFEERIEMEEGADDEELRDGEVAVGDQLVEHFAIGTPQQARSSTAAAQPRPARPRNNPHNFWRYLYCRSLLRDSRRRRLASSETPAWASSLKS